MLATLGYQIVLIEEFSSATRRRLGPVVAHARPMYQHLGDITSSAVRVAQTTQRLRAPAESTRVPPASPPREAFLAIARGVGVTRAPTGAPTHDAFACAPGGETIPASRVNDGFCDCPDTGADEPLDPVACAGIGLARRALFACAEGAPQHVFLSHVDDGVCDCCDGSDERVRTKCPNRCREGPLAKFASQLRGSDKKRKLSGEYRQASGTRGSLRARGHRR